MKPRALICVLAVLFTCGHLFYSLHYAFGWDAGYHLLAAQSVLRGRAPYLDFLFPQTPLHVYWNALWMRLLGENWRVPHVVSALCCGAAALLVADYVWTKFRSLSSAIAALCVIALNAQVVEYGGIGQPYGFCLLLIVLAFRVPAAAGLFSGCAAASSLLTAPVPIILFCKRPSVRFVAQCAVPFLPLLVLFIRDPHKVLYSVVEYQMLHRRVAWVTADQHNREVLLSAFTSLQVIPTVALAILGLRRNRKFLWIGVLAAAQALYLCWPHPTFTQYFMFTLPWLALLVGAARPAAWMTAVLALLLGIALAQSLAEDMTNAFWPEFEEMARIVDRVTPPNAPIMADEQIYFLTRRTPPPGMELADAHKLDPAAIERRIRSREFATIQTCHDPTALRLLYEHEAQVEDCYIFYSPKPIY